MDSTFTSHSHTFHDSGIEIDLLVRLGSESKVNLFKNCENLLLCWADGSAQDQHSAEQSAAQEMELEQA